MVPTFEHTKLVLLYGIKKLPIYILGLQGYNIHEEIIQGLENKFVSLCVIRSTPNNIETNKVTHIKTSTQNIIMFLVCVGISKHER